MADMEKKKLNKTTKSNLITYGMVLAAYLIVQGLIAGNLLSNLMQGLLVPLCVYIILALSLNLAVGILGELSLGHAGFMCVGAFAGALFSKCMKGAIGWIDRALHALGEEGAGEGADTHEACVSEAQLTEDPDGQV